MAAQAQYRFVGDQQHFIAHINNNGNKKQCTARHIVQQLVLISRLCFFFFLFSLFIWACVCVCVWEVGCIPSFPLERCCICTLNYSTLLFPFIYWSYKYVIKENTYYIHFACHYHHHRVRLSCTLYVPIISNVIMMNEDDCSLRLSTFLLKNRSRIDVFGFSFYVSKAFYVTFVEVL